MLHTKCAVYKLSSLPTEGVATSARAPGDLFEVPLDEEDTEFLGEELGEWWKEWVESPVYCI